MKFNCLKIHYLIGSLLSLLSPLTLYASSTCTQFPLFVSTFFDNSGNPHDAVLANVTGDNTQKLFNLPAKQAEKSSNTYIRMKEYTPQYNQSYTFTYHMEHTDFDCYVKVTTACISGVSYLTYKVITAQGQGSTDHNRQCHAKFSDYETGTPHLTITLSGDK